MRFFAIYNFHDFREKKIFIKNVLVKKPESCYLKIREFDWANGIEISHVLVECEEGKKNIFPTTETDSNTRTLANATTVVELINSRHFSIMVLVQFLIFF